MASYRLYQVDVFTREPFRGNPCGVVPEAEGLSESQMQAIATELGNPETVFILPPRSDEHDVWVRIFTPATEIPLAGHPTLAAHYIRAIEGTHTSGAVRQGAAGGLWIVSLEPDGDDFFVSARQSPVEFGAELDQGYTTALLAALGLSSAELEERGPVCTVTTGHGKVVLGVRSRAILNRLAPDMSALARLSREVEQDGIFLFTLDVDDPKLLTECRMFAPAIGIPEDPVTGSGQGPLGAYLVRHGLIDVVNGKASFRSLQGRALGRPGVARVVVEAPEGDPVAVNVGGNVVVVFKAEMDL